MKNIQFTTEEKEALFDKLASRCYRQNFGMLTKNEIEMLFFSALLDHCRTENISISDYEISELLGITQQRVRNLKVKEHLQYGSKLNWKKELASQAAMYPHFSADGTNITLSFEDPNVLIEVQHFIEQHGSFVDYSFNPKLLKMPVRDFASLLLEVGCTTNEAQTISKIRELFSEGFAYKPTEKTSIKAHALEFIKEAPLNIITGVITSLATEMISKIL